MVEDENDDVDEQLVNAVWVVIFVCMGKVFGDPCHVWPKNDIGEGRTRSIRTVRGMSSVMRLSRWSTGA